jgi:tetratricopeptide (TPR) repeat protein/KaiC/GvpD/RAD55 family RecA-like ATPase
LGIPSKIKDIILRRLAILKYNQRRVLDAASVIGEKFDVELLSTVLGQDSLEILETLNIVAQSTSLVCVEGNFFRFDHAKSREALYEEIPLPLKRGYHARIAERLEKTSKDGKLPFADLAYHYAQAGNVEKALNYALEAGKDALEKFSNSQAINHFAYVLQGLGDDPKHAQERMVALEGLGDAYIANNTFSEAMKTFEQLSDAATGILRLKVLRKAIYAAFLQGNVPRMTELIAKSEEYMPLDRLEAARIYGLKSGLFGLRGQVVPAMENGEKARRIIEEEYSLPDAARALAGRGFGKALHGGLEEGLASGLLAVAFFGEMGDLRQQMFMYCEVGSTFDLCGLFPEGLKIYEKALEIEEKMKLGDLRILAQIYWQLALTLESQNLEQALSKSLKALEYVEKTDSASVKGMVYGRLVIEYVRKEDPKSAEKYFEKLMKLPPQSLQSGWVQLSMVKAFYFAGKKDWQESMRHFKEHFDFIKTWRGSSGLGSPVVEATAKFDYAWALSKQGMVEEAAATVQEATKILEDAQKRFKHANVHLSLMAFTRVSVGQPFDVRLDLVNVSRGNGLLVNIQNMLPQEFQITATQPEIVRVDSSVQLKENKLEPFTVKTIKLTLQATKPGTFNLKPQIIYVDDLRQTKTCTPRPITITVKPSEPAFEVLAGRVTTGSSELDRLLLGGIPENYAVVLASPSIDERAMLVKKYLETGANSGEITFCITVEAGNTKTLAEQHPSNFYLFICNPQADAMVQSLPNVFKLKGVENLTDIDIALTKAFRTLNPSTAGPRRICIEVVSDALLQHHAINTRRWLSALLPTLKSKGFTILAMVDPQMHPPEETQAVLGLFDGEISIYEKETPKGTARFLKIKRMSNQKYAKDETLLT